MTIANTIKTAETMLADFQKSRAEIIARKVDNSLYMLVWRFEGSSLFVGRRPKAIEVGATGFVWAITFRDFASAQRYAHNIQNGRKENPVPVKVTDAREIALADTDGVIATMQTIVDAKKEA